MSAQAPILRAWAGLAGTLGTERGIEISLGPMCRMVEAAKRDGLTAELSLGGLFEEIERTLLPDIGDPLEPRLDLGSNRWLVRAHENAYSDWLCWIIDRQEDPRRVLTLFGLDERPDLIQPWTVQREVTTRFGRLDILLYSCLLGWLCIEVKTTSTPREDQLERYCKWLTRKTPRIGLVLLAVDEPEDNLPTNECSFCSWTHVAKNLRT